MKHPKISIVTPSFNQGSYLESTILSVIGQLYPNLEYIIMDGGSTDNSIDIIRKYEKHFAFWESVPDKGQSDAINKGFRIATGDILAWINSDDMYLPHTFRFISEYFSSNCDDKIVFGNCLKFNQETKKVYGSDVESSHKKFDISLCDYIIQPSCFWSRQIWEKVGPLNVDLAFGLDWDWFIRAQKLNLKFEPISEFLSIYRIHAQHKTGTGGQDRIYELAKIYEKYHSSMISRCYLKVHMDQKVVFARSLIQKFRLYRVLDPSWLMHILFFRELTRKQVDNILCM